MAGRRRRRSVSSSSTGAIPDGSRIRWMKELEILKPVDKDSDDGTWPIFELQNATIYRKDGRTMANPLLVNFEGPLVVRGHLTVDLEDEDQAPFLLKPSLSSAYIEIPSATTYSIGDRPATIWVAGETGWFEIRPSEAYKPIHDEALEATTFYFTALETYEEYNKSIRGRGKSNRQPPPSLDDVLLKYAVRMGNGILRDEAEALCRKWAEFLICHFNREKGLNWNPTPFAKQLREWYPDVHKRALDISKGIIPQPPPAPPAEPPVTYELQDRSRSARASSRNSGTEKAPTQSRSPPPKLISETPIPIPEKYRQFITLTAAPAPKPSLSAGTPRHTTLSPAHSEAVDRLVEVLHEIAEASRNVKKSKASSVLSKIYFMCKVRQPPKEYNYKSTVLDICSYYAKDLLARLPPEWKNTPFSQWLKDAASKPWTPILPFPPEEFPAQTFRRARVERKSAASKTLTASQLPLAITLKGQDTPAVKNDSDGDSVAEEEAWSNNVPPGGRRSGKVPALRLASSKKRPRTDSDYFGELRDTKSAKLSHDSDDGSDEDTSDEELVDAIESRVPLPEGTVRLVVHAERIPSTIPTGPENTWTCDQEGCGYVVRSALEQDAQAQIRAHFRDHEIQAEKIDLAVKESRGQMPINYLIDKIQNLGSRTKPTVNGQPVLGPVNRRLLI